ncbi:BUD32 protein kinase [Blastomyces gilchristii SLH14081]|uniref:EKC/KEOPS complex subunit BUD32 n=2 Tax=Blastomyces TaxID=229219 RepID=A0A179UUD1_BLAGS|nr:BUD32 protein kinase [Blastomyces gilchristii SLH14081]EGE78793.1 BUD32 protein kinase [Blastomyces dermatitidis ATCC 18188]EQL36501.1 BUD32 protein kinase [Blastomyces dermatitidis ATCC 26199]OAT10839.1 BUD32 protein kinase [Blastomyces gilchristii SLH14081]
MSSSTTATTTSTANTNTYTPPPLPAPFTNSPATLLAQGAEGRLYRTNFLTPSTPAALKIRPAKPYRHPILDRRLTRQRILQEARCLVKLAREEVPVPGLLALDVGVGDIGASASEGGSITNVKDSDQNDNKTGWFAWLLMEWVEGIVVRQAVDQWEKWLKSQEGKVAGGAGGADAKSADLIEQSKEDICALLRRIGLVVGAMHKAGIVHGDLTTSNLMLRPIASVDALAGEDDDAATAASVPLSTSIRQDAELQTITTLDNKPSLEGEIVLIDFGLAGQSVQDEDRAVDLYVLERAFGSSHPRTEPFFHEVLKGYAESYKAANVVLKKLEQVRLRGRKRSMVG